MSISGTIFEATVGSTNSLVSWLATIIGTPLLLAPPGIALIAAERFLPRIRYALFGVSAGALVTPFSIWLYLHVATDCFRGLLLGLPGVFLFALNALLLDGLPQALARAGGNSLDGVIVSGAVAWGLILGAAGAVADAVRFVASRPLRRPGASGEIDPGR